MADEDVEQQRFSVTGGRLLGVLGLLIAAAVLVLSLLENGLATPLGVYGGCLVAAAVVWSVLVRPHVLLRRDDLVLVNPVSTVTVPLAAVETLVVAQSLAVLAEGRRYLCTGIGRSPRQTRKDGRRETVEDPTRSYGGFVEERIRSAVRDARDRAGRVDGSGDERRVTRRWAWPEIAALVTGAVLLLVGLAV